MTTKHKFCQLFSGHRVIIMVVLCLFGLSMVQSQRSSRKKQKARDEGRVYLDHADELRFDDYSKPGVQIVKGNVAFTHNGLHLTCDSAYFNENARTFDAFGHVRMRQGDTLSLTSDYAYYDGMDEMLRARHHVVLRHRGSVLYCDSLDYDRKFSFGYFFEGGRLVDGKNTLVSDWGEYSTKTREATFYYAVHLKTPKDDIHTDTLHYDTRTRIAHILGPSTIINDGNLIKSSDAWYDTRNDKSKLFGRSTITSKDKHKTITGDSLYYNSKTGISNGYGNVIYTDHHDKNQLTGGYCYYDEKKGFALATRRPVAIDFSQKDTLYMHSDTIKMYTFNINTDSVYRKVHSYFKVRAYRKDVQGVCDSLVFNTKDSCMTMYRDPIVWSDNRQLLGEVIKVYMNDSTVRWAHVIGQALSVELMNDKQHYNQVASKEMKAFFDNGHMRESEAIGNVQSVYYPIDDKDSSLIGLNYIETDTMRMFLNKQQKLDRIWMPKAEGTLYPMTQIPPQKLTLPTFAWFDYVRPLDKDDIFNWRGKKKGSELKTIRRHAAPLQTFGRPSSGGETEGKGALQ